MRKTALVCLLVVATSFGGPAAPQATGPVTLAQEADKLFSAALSQYQASQVQQAKELFDSFVKRYPTSEKYPAAYVLLAASQLRSKDLDGYDATLEEIIRKLHGSLAWPIAYGAKLKRALEAGDKDGYLNALEAMVRRTQEVIPLGGIDVRTTGLTGGQDFRSIGALNYTGIGQIADDLLVVADTPERARRAQGLLAQTFRLRAKELPCNAQFLHYQLILRCGDEKGADQKFLQYFTEWGDHPDAVKLWLLKAEQLRKQNDLAGARETYAKLMKDYPGYDSLSSAMADRLKQLADEDNYVEFVELSRFCMSSYGPEFASGTIYPLWKNLALPSGNVNAERVDDLLKVMDEIFPDLHPDWRDRKIRDKIDILLAQGQSEQAAELAGHFHSHQQWGTASLALLERYAKKHKAFEAVVAAARQQWGLPGPTTDEAALKMLADLKAHLKDDQTRHADEIAEEMLAKFPAEQATIEAMSAIADYYFQKALAPSRDKWLQQIVDRYPHTPAAQKAITTQITAAGAEKRFDDLARAMDKLKERFPSATDNQKWLKDRLACKDDALDAEARSKLWEEYWQPRADAGSVRAMEETAASLGGHVAAGYWLKQAGKHQGKQLEIICLRKAWSIYIKEGVEYQQAAEVAKRLRTQTISPETAWQTAFGEVQLAAANGLGKEALDKLKAIVRPGKQYRDLAQRIDFEKLAPALASDATADEALRFLPLLQQACITTADKDAVEYALATVKEFKGDYAGAAGHHLKIVRNSRVLASRVWFFKQALKDLAKVRSPQYLAELNAYVGLVSPGGMEVLPGLYQDLGEFYLRNKDRAVFGVQQILSSQYAASAARDRLDSKIAQVRSTIK